MDEITKILVIESRHMISAQLKRNLNPKKNIVFMVQDMVEAIERLKIINFDILVVDIQKKGDYRQNYLMLRSIRWMSPQIKIILIIGGEKIKQINEWEGLEISDLIPKPWKNKDLITSINHLLIQNSLVCFSKT